MLSNEAHKVNYYLNEMIKAKKVGKEIQAMSYEHKLLTYCEEMKMKVPELYYRVQSIFSESQKVTPVTEQQAITTAETAENVTNCLICNEPLSRKNAKTCSAKCRSVLFRQKNSG